MELRDEIDYLKRQFIKIAVRPPIEVSCVRTNPKISDSPTMTYIELTSVLVKMETELRYLSRANKELKKDLLGCVLNSGQLDWVHAAKRNLLEKWFPEEIPKQPYYNGGDL